MFLALADMEFVIESLGNERSAARDSFGVVAASLEFVGPNFAAKLHDS